MDPHKGKHSVIVDVPRPVGLILGSGGIRGAAHAGAIHALGQAGIRAGVVVGASVGAIFGLGVAAGLDPERIWHDALSFPIDSTFRLYRNRLRIDRTTPLGKALTDIGEDTCLEDLPVPFACMALDWETGELVAIRRGPVLLAVQASFALPFIARPVEIEGRRYMDGGLKGPVPATVARDMGAAFVISVRLVGRPDPPRRLSRYHGIGRFLDRVPLGKVGEHISPRQHLLFVLRTYSYNFSPLLAVPGDRADLEIWPRFHGLGKSAPFGARYCMRLGEIAGREAIAALAATRSEALQSAGSELGSAP